MSFRRKAVASALALGLGVAGCGDDEDKGGSSEAKPSTLALSLSGSGKNVTLTGPKSVPSGVVKIVLESKVKGDHSAQLIRYDGDRTPEQIDAAGDAWGDKGKPLPEWLHLEGGVEAEFGKATTSTQILLPGKYVALDIQSEGGKTPSVAFEVTDGEGGGELPQPAATVLMKEYAFDGVGLKAGRQKVLVENAGREPHFIVGAPLEKGATVADAQKFFASEGEGSEGPPPVDFEAGFSTGVIDGGNKRMVLDFDLKSGRYVFVCFIPDREGGPPHVAKGMVSEITVR